MWGVGGVVVWGSGLGGLVVGVGEGGRVAVMVFNLVADIFSWESAGAPSHSFLPGLRPSRLDIAACHWEMR
jgi:hypothetical protein